MKRTILIQLSFIVIGFTVVGCKTSPSRRSTKVPTFNIEQVRANISADFEPYKIVWKPGTCGNGEAMVATETSTYASIHCYIELAPSRVTLVGDGSTSWEQARTLVGIRSLIYSIFGNVEADHVYNRITVPLLLTFQWDTNSFERNWKGYTFQVRGYPDKGQFLYSIYKT